LRKHPEHQDVKLYLFSFELKIIFLHFQPSGEADRSPAAVDADRGTEGGKTQDKGTHFPEAVHPDSQK
jgi:hypothetical protein